MTHIELSLTPIEPTVVDALTMWAAPLASAEESCLVLDSAGHIIAASVPWARLLGHSHPAALTRLHVLDRSVLILIDFTAAGNELGEAEREQIPPLLALSSGRPARGLMRIRDRSQAGSRTLDAIATPLVQAGQTVGALSFFEAV
jgi:hypothetical protein